jgi:hypothetical protein
MFSKPPAKGALTDRVRQLAERKTQPVAREVATPRKEEQRPARRPLFRQGFIVFESGQKLRVAVKNLSETGARLEFFTQSELPDEIILVEPTLDLRRRARVVWQRAGVAGVRFV